MHPDALIAALKAELETARDDEHRKQIKAEIERVDKLPRPSAKAEEPETVFDRRRVYIDALKEELTTARDKDHEAAIKAEIKRAEGALDEEESVEDDTEPSAEEVEQRKKARAGGRRVQRATSAPGEERETNPDDEKSE